ncbi:Dye-decolorizing peroxidase msp1 [Rhizoctonia solani]|uniref:Dye-decolorizing peroxidase msp1 n=1 Tax=Rhizoctonia solani TaxID=456999 RepID=A0A0K6G3K1_9AGAM|nr:Dye-decolorizing peroxidase msp1 [Rhizoctonia solani]
MPPFTLEQVARIKRSIVPRETTGGINASAPLPSYPIPDPKNIQGDVYTAFSKGHEDFMFFTLVDRSGFKQWLASFNPTNSFDVAQDLKRILASSLGDRSRVKVIQTQIAFSRAGLDYLGETGKVGDFYFDKGKMFLDKDELTDRGKWDNLFEAGPHACIIVAADSRSNCHEKVRELQGQISGFVSNLAIIHGRERPGAFRGHEHFGYMDGISQPALRGLTDCDKVPEIMWRHPGVIIMGYNGDPNFDGKDPITYPPRPDWTKDGSFMVFRKLEQDVPEFNAYVVENGKRWREFIPEEGKEGQVQLTDLEGAKLFGAQMFGRWKSGAPLQLFPIKDNEEAAKDPKINNRFDYHMPGKTRPSAARCPFTAHVRKVNPRQLDPFLSREFIDATSIIRSSIPYGPEMTEAEKASGKSSSDPSLKRGLLFVCYQSSIQNGFMEQSKGFAGNDFFPAIDLKPKRVGQDPIIGAPPLPASVTLTISGMDGREDIDMLAAGRLKDTAFALSGSEQQFFVTSRGGEYFFVPSVSELKRLARL